MNLILYGSTETVYTLNCELVNTTHNDLKLNDKIYEYLEKGERYMYHMTFKNTNGNYSFEHYVFRVAIFTGELDYKFYKDENKKEEITGMHPAMFMGDMQHVIRLEEAEKMPNGLFVDILSPDRTTTFMMEFEGRTKNYSFELHEHISEFVAVKKVEKAYFRVGVFGTQDDTNNASIGFTFTEIAVQGKV